MGMHRNQHGNEAFDSGAQRQDGTEVPKMPVFPGIEMFIAFSKQLTQIQILIGRIQSVVDRNAERLSALEDRVSGKTRATADKCTDQANKKGGTFGQENVPGDESGPVIALKKKFNQMLWMCAAIGLSVGLLSDWGEEIVAYLAGLAGR